MLILVACAPEPTPVSTPLPTQTLIPATATATVTPITPTATLPDLIAPEDLLVTATPTPPIPLLGSADDVPADLVQLAIQQLADDENIAPEMIRLVENESRLYFGLDDPCEIILSPAADDVLSGYRMQLLDGQLVYSYHVDEEGLVFRCSDGEPIQDELLAEIDPIAGELLDLARRRLANELDLSILSLSLIELQPLTWADSSLGCPQPNQTYTEAAIDGYRIVLGVGEREYAYHTDAVAIIACEIGQEQLPEN